MAIATIAGGCFWCIEAAFNSVSGIEQATSGYMGGITENPDYKTVCTGETGHAEVVKLQFDEKKTELPRNTGDLFALHNPTQLNRQGDDIGTQYRSAIFFHDESQQQIAQGIINEMISDKTWGEESIVTEVTAAKTFYPAEQYHQGYAENNPQNQYCAMVVSPKLAKFKKTFASRLK